MWLGWELVRFWRDDITLSTTRPTRVSLFRIFRIGFALSPLVGVHLALLAIPFVPLTWTSVILFLVVTRIAGLGVTVGLHRYLSHRAFRTSRWFQFLLAASGCCAMQKGPLWWVAHHRDHHKHSDTPLDPHSPVSGSLWHGHAGWLFTADRMEPDFSRVKDLTVYRELVWLDKLWMIPGLLMALGCFLLDGWSGVVYGFCAAVVLVFQVTFAVNSFGHRFGPQRFATGDGSRNNFLLGVLAMGDGWHNNHHRAPTSARHGLAWYEIDQSYLFIRFLRAIGIVWAVRQPPPAVVVAAA